MTDSRRETASSRVPGILLRGWWAIVAAAVVGGSAAFAYSASQTPTFRSDASIYFSLRTGTSGSDINQGSTYTQNQMLSFAQLATSAVVLEPVEREVGIALSLRELRQSIDVTIPQNTVILNVAVSSPDPQVAADIANSVASNLATVVGEITPVAADGQPSTIAQVIEPAEPAVVQSAPNKTRDAALGGFAGGLVAAVGLALFAVLDTRVRSENALRRVTDIPLLGIIPHRRGSTKRPAMVDDSNTAVAEAYRSVRTSLRFAAVEHSLQIVVVTSSIPGEGKTTTVVNSALAYAEAGLRVLVVDADLRRPTVAKVLGVENAVGLTSVLAGMTEVDDALLTWGTSSLQVLTAGEAAPNPAELLASSRMAEVLDDLRGRFDFIIVDTAPLLSVSDSAQLSQHTDATIVVVDARQTRLTQVADTLRRLTISGADTAGVILNNVRVKKQRSYY